MAFDYTPFQQLSASQIREFGAIYKMKKPDGSSAGTAPAVLTNQSKRDAQGVITAEKVMLIASGTKFTPQVGMFMEHGKDVYRIETIDVLQPGPAVVLYKATVTV
ncbi:hypothetical protein [Acidovorax sp.]|uniref:hypothetical protein n=1 Tax=Acidovorax sp. TaxID=1872122 RepID=UPI00391EFE65